MQSTGEQDQISYRGLRMEVLDLLRADVLRLVRVGGLAEVAVRLLVDAVEGSRRTSRRPFGRPSEARGPCAAEHRLTAREGLNAAGTKAYDKRLSTMLKPFLTKSNMAQYLFYVFRQYLATN